MSLGDALYAELTGGLYTNQDDDDDDGDDYSFQDALEDLGRGQSISAFARELGVPRTTLRGWIAGRRPKMDVAPIVDVARSVRREEQLAGREDELADMSGITVDGWLTVSKDVSRRVVNAKTLQLDRDLGANLVDAYRAGGGPAELRRVFINGVGEPWYRSQLRNNQWNVLTVDGWA